MVWGRGYRGKQSDPQKTLQFSACPHIILESLTFTFISLCQISPRIGGHLMHDNLYVKEIIK